MLNGINIVINLLILGIFKYYNFFAENLSDLFLLMGLDVDVVTLKLALPLGISFYSFQAISYTVDVYKKRTKAIHNVVDYFLYIFYFPKLIAGPIERVSLFMPQVQQTRTFDYNGAVLGLRQMLWGFFKKMVIADSCAAFINFNYGTYTDLPVLMYIELAVLFSFQIYADFSGYSDIAIGCSKLFGINLSVNFNYPYFSRSITEFWRRWHISLMSWLKDYVYIPLGGSRQGSIRTYTNICVVFILSGLWHGANWTFIFWGAYNAILLIFERITGSNKIDYQDKGNASYLPQTIKGIPQMLSTFLLATIGWMIFRANNINEFFYVVRAFMTHDLLNANFSFSIRCAIGIIIMILVEWYQKDKKDLFNIDDIKLLQKKTFRWSFYYVIILLIFFLSSRGQDFIYYQF